MWKFEMPQCFVKGDDANTAMEELKNKIKVLPEALRVLECATNREK